MASDRPHIFLTGFMGAGKSSVGKDLAARIGKPFVDLDQIVVDTAGMSVSEIFAMEGEDSFRQREHEALRAVVDGCPAVVATGGGVVLREENRRLMRQHGVIVNLLTDPETVQARLAGDDSRPLLKEDGSSSRIRAMLAEREPCYADADVRIETPGAEIAEIVETILVWLKKAGR